MFKELLSKIKNMPLLDKEFIPLSAVKKYADENSVNEVQIALEKKDACSIEKINLTQNDEFNKYYGERIVKFLLWQKGAYKMGIMGDESFAEHIMNIYCKNGERSFDAEFMSRIYEEKFEVGVLDVLPKNHENLLQCGGNLNGCRIGVDLGGSDMKICAVQDGNELFSKEVVWHPKANQNPKYHYTEIMQVLKQAASYLPEVNALGISCAGIFFENRCMISSLCLKVPQSEFDSFCKDMYINIAKEFSAPMQIMNDGDVASLAGAMTLKKNNLLAIAFGTSEAAGFVDGNGNLKTWLNEMAFAPVDISKNASVDDWSQDRGCGATYFSQEGVIRMGENAGIHFDENLTSAQKLCVIQELAERGDEKALSAFESVGCYLGHGAALYHQFYNMENLLLLGRGVSKTGGEIILDTAKKVLHEDYQNINLNIWLPDEKTRKVGQAYAAASLPKVVL